MKINCYYAFIFITSFNFDYTDNGQKYSHASNLH